MTQELSESSLTPPSSGTSVFAIRMRKNEGTKRSPEQKACNLHEPWWWLWCGRWYTTTMFIHSRAYACTEFGWQNAWEQAPGVPATPSPPWWRESTLALCLCTGPYKHIRRHSSRLCMITGTSKTIDERRHVIDHTAPVVAQRRACATPVSMQKGATVGDRLSLPRLHSKTARPARPTTTTLSMYSYWRISVGDQGKLHLRHDRDDDELHCGSRLS